MCVCIRNIRGSVSECVRVGLFLFVHAGGYTVKHNGCK